MRVVVALLNRTIVVRPVLDHHTTVRWSYPQVQGRRPGCARGPPSGRRRGDPSQAEGGVVQALSVSNWWRGYLTDYGEPSKLVFSLQDPKPVLCMKGDVQVTVEPKGRNRHWDYEVTGSFVQRSCAIKNRAGHVAAQIGVKGMLAGRDFYQVVVQPGYDQAFVVGVIAILDNIHGESTRC
uniref:Tubby C-terminal domain-containing protein n=1 Tax=Setaria viridis TaxID=4556 RepID=A0A4U6T7R9_SETVI|nr:hypothetical protein SEVIR_9G523700v2 [Setaria viridis]